jgi:hypothetical protein
MSEALKAPPIGPLEPWVLLYRLPSLCMFPSLVPFPSPMSSCDTQGVVRSSIFANRHRSTFVRSVERGFPKIAQLCNPRGLFELPFLQTGIGSILCDPLNGGFPKSHSCATLGVCSNFHFCKPWEVGCLGRSRLFDQPAGALRAFPKTTTPEMLLRVGEPNRGPDPPRPHRLLDPRPAPFDDKSKPGQPSPGFITHR